MGPAVVEPYPAFSTRVAIAILGLSAGANITKMESSSPLEFWAVPVFPALSTPGI